MSAAIAYSYSNWLCKVEIARKTTCKFSEQDDYNDQTQVLPIPKQVFSHQNQETRAELLAVFLMNNVQTIYLPCANQKPFVKITYNKLTMITRP